MAIVLRTLVTLVLFLCVVAQAEILHDIQPLDTLGEIKKKYPNAKFVRVKAAWVTEEQDFFSMSGQGFPGTLYLAFSDYRPSYRRMLAKERAELDPTDDDAKRKVEIFQAVINEPDDEALSIEWVRWVPADPIPIARYKSKYGEPSKCDFNAADMHPFCQWNSRSLRVRLSDDQKNVVYAESEFTKAELRNEWLRKRGYVPDFLKDQSEPQAAPQSKGKPK